MFDNVKTVMLEDELGAEGVLALIRLWCYSARNSPKGQLKKSNKFVALAARYTGCHDTFVGLLLDIGFLDEDDNYFYLHDWKEHNPFAFFAEERSEAARKSAEEGWKKRRKSNG